MSQPTISIQDSGSTSKAVPNLLPCRVHHDGLINPMNTYWKSASKADGTKEAYFRGRKLHGQPLSLPSTHRGVILERRPNEQLPIDGDAADDDVQETLEAGKMEVKAEFDEVVVWGHERLGNAEDDIFVRGVEEWLAVADKIHSYSEAEHKGQK